MVGSKHRIRLEIELNEPAHWPLVIVAVQAVANTLKCELRLLLTGDTIVKVIEDEGRQGVKRNS
jgi:hypothetical protein